MLQKQDEVIMTDKQYRSLRSLFILWLKVLAHNKYRLFKNISILLLILINLIFLKAYLKNQDDNEKLIRNLNSIHSKKVSSLYDLNLYRSHSRDKDNLGDRFDALYEKYLNDKKQPDYVYYDKRSPNKVLKWHYNNCINQLRRARTIRSRIVDIQTSIIYLDPENKKVWNDLFREKGYEETLANISNYYSRFIPLETYKYLLRTTD